MTLVMHLCPLCNRRYKYFYDDVDDDDDDDETETSLLFHQSNCLCMADSI